MSLNDLIFKAGLVSFHSHNNDTADALKTFDEMIRELLSTNDYVHDEKLKRMLIMCCIKRININFKEKNYHKVVTDMNTLTLVEYDIYANPDIFTIPSESIAGLCDDKINAKLEKCKIHSIQIEAYKKHFGEHFDAQSILAKEVSKPAKKNN
ncbi:unnamed protein product [Rotaria socialis]|uniref:Uncharacterized protein n=2 Tax=Rotaria socialis TaxID=392032 RepID=A0A820VR04_9BILA|nr:unnamed protein product [Rotaria socialis]CAF4505825.1 unnamed protein product [Rotaria socialis]